MVLTDRTRESRLDRTVRAFRAVIERLPSDQVEQLKATLDGVAHGDHSAPAADVEEVERAIAPTIAEFQVRQRLLAESLTAPEVAQCLGVSRQTPHDRVKTGTLLAVMDRGMWRFPAWQFDPSGPDGVLPGLPETIKALGDMPLLSKIGWMTSPKVLLPEPPVAMLRRGDAAAYREVLLAAESAGRL